MNKRIPQELLDAVDYDPATGILRWRVSFANGVKAGDQVGYVNPFGYVITNYKGGGPYLVHRIAYTKVHGTCPPILDHRNGDPTDNSIGNLRPATVSQNGQNSKRTKPRLVALPRGVTIMPPRKYVTKTGEVRFYQRARPYKASVAVSGRKTHLGTFATPDEAATAFRDAAARHYGEFARPE